MDARNKLIWIKEADEEVQCVFLRQGNGRGVARTKKRVRFIWEALVNHRYTINVNGSVKTGLNKAGFGGVLRNSKGE